MKTISRNLLLSLFMIELIGCSFKSDKALDKFKEELLPIFYKCVGAQGSVKYDAGYSDDVDKYTNTDKKFILVDVKMKNRLNNNLHIQYLYNIETSTLDTRRPHFMSLDDQKMIPLYHEKILNLFCM